MGDSDVAYVCHEASFVPAHSHEVRWFDVEEDFTLLRAFHEQRSADETYTLEDACQWRDAGFTDAGVIEGGVIVARAARWIYSDDAWELAGVFTVPERRGAGLSRSVCSFVTAAILSSGKTATCHTPPTNLAMRRVAGSLGYTLLE